MWQAESLSGSGRSSNASFALSPPKGLLGMVDLGNGRPSNASFALAPPEGLHGMFRNMLDVDAEMEGADQGDPLDQVMMLHLAQIRREAPKAKLVVRRLGTGRYDIDGRQVSLRLGIGPGFARNKPLVREEDIKREHWLVADEVELLAYLRQAASVAVSLGRTAVARIPKDLRVSFVETNAPGASTTLRDIKRGLIEDGAQRCHSMRLACEQAQLRELAAAMFERNGPLWQGIGALGPSVR